MRGSAVPALPGGDIKYAFAASEGGLFLSPRAGVQAGAPAKSRSIGSHPPGADHRTPLGSPAAPRPPAFYSKAVGAGPEGGGAGSAGACLRQAGGGGARAAAFAWVPRTSHPTSSPSTASSSASSPPASSAPRPHAARRPPPRPPRAGRHGPSSAAPRGRGQLKRGANMGEGGAGPERQPEQPGSPARARPRRRRGDARARRRALSAFVCRPPRYWSPGPAPRPGSRP